MGIAMAISIDTGISIATASATFPVSVFVKLGTLKRDTRVIKIMSEATYLGIATYTISF